MLIDENSIQNKINSNKKSEYVFETTCKTKYSKTLKSKISVYNRVQHNTLSGYYFFIEDISMDLKKKNEYEKNIEHMNIVRNVMNNGIIFRKEINKEINKEIKK